MSACQIYATIPPTNIGQRHLYFSWQCKTCNATGDDIWDQSKCPQWDEGPDVSMRPLPRILVEMAERAIDDLEGDLASREAEIDQYGEDAAKLVRLMEERDMIRAQIEEIRDAIKG